MALRGSSVPGAARTIASWCGRPEVAGALSGILHQALRDGLVVAPPRPMPGAVALVGRLQGLRRLAVASNAPGDVLRATLTETGVLDRVDLVVSADDVDMPKPAPDVYLTACRKLGVPPRAAVALEDSDLGASAALAAGLLTVQVVADSTSPAGNGPASRPRPGSSPAVAPRVRSLRDPLLAALVLPAPEPDSGPVTPGR